MADEHMPVGQQGNAKILAEISTGHVAEVVSISTAIGLGSAVVDVWGTSTGVAIVTDTSGTIQQYNRGLVRSIGGSSDAAIVTDTSGTIEAYLRGLVVALTSDTAAADAGAAGSLSAKARRLTQDMGRLYLTHSRHEIIRHPFGVGSLTTDGVQYSAATTTVSTEWTAIETVTVSPPGGGNLVELEFGLTMSVGRSTAAYISNHKWQAATVGSTWVDLTAAFASSAAASTAYVEYTHSGYFSTANANLMAMPVTARLVVQSSGTTGQSVTARTKNSSYTRFVYEST